MKVKCIGAVGNLILNKVYKVIEEDNEYYFLKEISGGYYKDRFEEVKEMKVDKKAFEILTEIFLRAHPEVKTVIRNGDVTIVITQNENKGIVRKSPNEVEFTLAGIHLAYHKAMVKQMNKLITKKTKLIKKAEKEVKEYE